MTPDSVTIIHMIHTLPILTNPGNSSTCKVMYFGTGCVFYLWSFLHTDEKGLFEFFKLCWWAKWIL